MVAVDYLGKDDGHRILAMRADSGNAVSFSTMRTARGDFVDSSAAQRARLVSGERPTQLRILASASARLLSNADSGALSDIAALGYGGIYVLSGPDADTNATQRLTTNINASDGVQAVASSSAGSYYRLLSEGDCAIDAAGARRAAATPWRIAWLVVLGVVVAMYVLVALPWVSSRRVRREEA